MAKRGYIDGLSTAFANAMRDAFKQWCEEHGNGQALELLWTQDIDRIDVSAHYTPRHRGVLVVEVHSKRPGRSELYPYSLNSYAVRRRRKGDIG